MKEVAGCNPSDQVAGMCWLERFICMVLIGLSLFPIVVANAG